MADSTTPEQPAVSEQAAKKIEPLKLKTVNDFRARAKRVLKSATKVVLPAVFVAHVGGAAAQGYFRKEVGFNPNKTVPADTRSGKKKEEVETPQETPNTTKESSGEGEEKKSRWERAKKALRKAKEWSNKKIDTAKDRSEIVKKYRETKKDAKDAYLGLIKAVDKSAYWGPFLLLFLATALLASKISKFKNIGSVEPAEVAEELEDIKATLNTLIEANNKECPSTEEVKALMVRFDKISAALEEGMDNED